MASGALLSRRGAVGGTCALPHRPGPRLAGEPWRKPRWLIAFTVAYLLWALVPVLIAIQFSFNAGRSRSAWRGFSVSAWP